MAPILNNTTKIMRRAINISGIIILTILVFHAGIAWAWQNCNRKLHEGAGHHAAAEVTGAETAGSSWEFVDNDNDPHVRLHCLDVAVTPMLAVEISKTSSLKPPRSRILSLTAGRVDRPVSVLGVSYLLNDGQAPYPAATPRHLFLSVLIN